jgi:hypothetical protein
VGRGGHVAGFNLWLDSWDCLTARGSELLESSAWDVWEGGRVLDIPIVDFSESLSLLLVGTGRFRFNVLNSSSALKGYNFFFWKGLGNGGTLTPTTGFRVGALLCLTSISWCLQRPLGLGLESQPCIRHLFCGGTFGDSEAPLPVLFCSLEWVGKLEFVEVAFLFRRHLPQLKVFLLFNHEYMPGSAGDFEPSHEIDCILSIQ